MGHYSVAFGKLCVELECEIGLLNADPNWRATQGQSGAEVGEWKEPGFNL